MSEDSTETNNVQYMDPAMALVGSMLDGLAPTPPEAPTSHSESSRRVDLNADNTHNSQTVNVDVFKCELNLSPLVVGVAGFLTNLRHKIGDYLSTAQDNKTAVQVEGESAVKIDLAAPVTRTKTPAYCGLDS